MLIANSAQPDITRWNWEIGAGLRDNGGPLRDLKRPSRGGQPEHMNQFKQLPHNRASDYGGVHINSGIHNQAAFKLMTARKQQRSLFNPEDLAALFYLSLTQHLTRNSGFSASRRGVTLAAHLLSQRPARRLASEDQRH